MESQGWWNGEAEEDLKTRLKADVMKAFKKAENVKRCELGELFTDVYGGEEPWNIVRCVQRFEVLAADVFPTLEGATGRAYGPVAKVRRGLGALANRAG